MMPTTLQGVMVQDLEALFGEYGFAEDAFLRLASGEERAIRVIFDEAYQELDLKTKAPVGAVTTAVHVQTASLPEFVEAEDRILVRGKLYRMQMPKPDGHGAAVVRLTKVST